MTTETPTETPPPKTSKTPAPAPKIKDQLEALKRRTYTESVLTVIHANGNLTFKELSEMIADDELAVEVLMNTPLRDLVSDEAAPVVASTAKNGRTRKVKAKPNGKPKAKKTAKKTAKKAPTKPAPAMSLKAFLSRKQKGATFKTVDYKDAAQLNQQTALNHLHKSSAVRMKGKKRAAVWVVR
jgi:hypothetical protein